MNRYHVHLRRCRDARGMSLIELLIVLAMMGVVATAIFSLFLSTQRTASTSEEVMEVQQNLRIAMDLLTRDLRMAGFMIPRDQQAFNLAQPAMLTTRTGTADNIAARITNGVTLVGNDVETFNIAEAGMVELFSVGDQVWLLRPPSQAPPVGFNFVTVSNTSTAPVPQLQLSGLGGFGGIEIVAGDMIVRNALAQVNTVTYCLDPVPGCGPAIPVELGCPAGQSCLKRVENIASATPGAEIVATNIAAAGLVFTYLLADGSETANPTDLNSIRGVRINLTGRSYLPSAPPGNSTRTLTSVVRLRNR